MARIAKSYRGNILGGVISKQVWDIRMSSCPTAPWRPPGEPSTRGIFKREKAGREREFSCDSLGSTMPDVSGASTRKSCPSKWQFMPAGLPGNPRVPSGITAYVGAGLAIGLRCRPHLRGRRHRERDAQVRTDPARRRREQPRSLCRRPAAEPTLAASADPRRHGMVPALQLRKPEGTGANN